MHRSYFVVLVLMVLFSSCEYDLTNIDYNMGDFFVDDPANVYFVDTMQLRSYSIVNDSFVTSMADRLLAGRYVNSYGIETYCESYFRFDPTSYSDFDENLSAEYDSVSLILYPDDYKFGDTTVVAGFDVYRLTEAIVYDELTYSIYNTTRFETEAEPIGEFYVDYNSSFDSIVVRLPDDFGRDLFDLVYEDSDILQSEDLAETNQFKDVYFKGLKITPKSDNNTLVIGLDATVDGAENIRIDVYYHDNTVNDELTIPFNIETGSIGIANQDDGNYYASTYIHNSYGESIIAGETEDEMLEGHSDITESRFPANKSDNVTFAQSGYMLSTRIEIPYIDYLSDYGEGAVVKAELKVYPLNGTFDEIEDLPTNLKMDIIDERNDFYALLYDVDNSSFVTGVLNWDNDFKNNVYYSFDLTNFVKTEYEELSRPQYSLRLSTLYDSGSPDVDQLILGGYDNEDNQMELEVYFTTFKN